MRNSTSLRINLWWIYRSINQDISKHLNSIHLPFCSCPFRSSGLIFIHSSLHHTPICFKIWYSFLSFLITHIFILIFFSRLFSHMSNTISCRGCSYIIQTWYWIFIICRIINLSWTFWISFSSIFKSISSIISSKSISFCIRIKSITPLSSNKISS